ncbi:MAG: hypothetical protein NTX56_04930 [Proteobacteria bacterium]|jgi:hypothetical protein|nr:hypothetical protein [Pseudomonadota bacterium]
MAMTKKEMAEVEALRQERDIYRAMVISGPVAPDVHRFEGGYSREDFNRGWLPLVYGEVKARVEKAAVSSVHHRFGDNAWSDSSRYGWSQNTRSLYSTKLAAWKQARHEASMICAKALAVIDREIEKCEKDEGTI